jgi:hypothetical protein
VEENTFLVPVPSIHKLFYIRQYSPSACKPSMSFAIEQTGYVTADPKNRNDQ